MTYTYEQISNALLKHKNEEHTLGEWIDIFVKAPKPAKHIFTPLDEFVLQLNFEGSVTNSKIYNMYLAWCDDAPLEKDPFSKRLPKALREHRPDIVPYRSGKIRGYRMTVS